MRVSDLLHRPAKLHWLLLHVDSPHCAAHAGSPPLPTIGYSQFTHQPRADWLWDLDGFEKWPCRMCFFLKVKGIKSEIHIFERFVRCLHFPTQWRGFWAARRTDLHPTAGSSASWNSDQTLCSWLTDFSVFTFLVWVLWLQLNFLTPN